MDFFHFGPSDELFGSYTPASGRGRSEAVAVLCYPFGQEYMRAHRSFRQVAVLLSRNGVPVFRFDYFGTGDSAGEGEQSRLDRWVDDCGAAIDEARRRSRAHSVRLAGLRLGGTIGTLAAAGRDDVDRLVLWDPVVRGHAYVEDLERSTSQRDGDLWWVHGFPVSPSLRDDIDRVDLTGVAVPDRTRVVQMISHADEHFDALTRTLEGRSGGTETRTVGAPSDWNYSDDLGGILIPRDMVRALVEVLGA